MGQPGLWHEQLVQRYPQAAPRLVRQVCRLILTLDEDAPWQTDLTLHLRLGLGISLMPLCHAIRVGPTCIYQWELGQAQPSVPARRRLRDFVHRLLNP